MKHSLRDDETLWTWGAGLGLTDGISGQLVQLSSINDVTAMAAGNHHALILRKNGTVVALGNNSYGQLGDGSTLDSRKPVSVSQLSDVSAISAGFQYSLALKKDGSFWAWGNNEFGQLGDGTKQTRLTPIKVETL